MFCDRSFPRLSHGHILRRPNVAHAIVWFFQEAALAEVRRAAEELQRKKQEVESAQVELTHAQEEKNRAGKDIDAAAKIMTGDDAVVAKLAEGLQKDGYVYVDNFLGEPLCSYIQQEVIRSSHTWYMSNE